ncbi:hypothetical protein ABT039_22205 [Streptomyces lasiicapitis]|uniref:hypothetical protein n=1 Tax=Streptomyces lasiicapitis TaxID=1923961 RepID=UPI003324DB90
MTKPMTVTCTNCGSAADLPENRDHAALWDAGWRWIGSALVSCPPCPPVLVIDGHGRHRRPQQLVSD